MLRKGSTSRGQPPLTDLLRAEVWWACPQRYSLAWPCGHSLGVPSSGLWRGAGQAREACSSASSSSPPQKSPTGCTFTWVQLPPSFVESLEWVHPNLCAAPSHT